MSGVFRMKFFQGFCGGAIAVGFGGLFQILYALYHRFELWASFSSVSWAKLNSASAWTFWFFFNLACFSLPSYSQEQSKRSINPLNVVNIIKNLITEKYQTIYSKENHLNDDELFARVIFDLFSKRWEVNLNMKMVMHSFKMMISTTICWMMIMKMNSIRYLMKMNSNQNPLIKDIK